jgi:hypothetical protein
MWVCSGCHYKNATEQVALTTETLFPVSSAGRESKIKLWADDLSPGLADDILLPPVKQIAQANWGLNLSDPKAWTDSGAEISFSHCHCHWLYDLEPSKKENSTGEHLRGLFKKRGYLWRCGWDRESAPDGGQGPAMVGTTSIPARRGRAERALLGQWVRAQSQCVERTCHCGGGQWKQAGRKPGTMYPLFFCLAEPHDRQKERKLSRTVLRVGLPGPGQKGAIPGRGHRWYHFHAERCFSPGTRKVPLPPTTSSWTPEQQPGGLSVPSSQPTSFGFS